MKSDENTRKMDVIFGENEKKEYLFEELMQFTLFKTMYENDKTETQFKLQKKGSFGYKEIDFLIQLKLKNKTNFILNDINEVNQFIEANNYLDCGDNTFCYFLCFLCFFFRNVFVMRQIQTKNTNLKKKIF